MTFLRRLRSWLLYAYARVFVKPEVRQWRRQHPQLVETWGTREDPRPRASRDRTLPGKARIRNRKRKNRARP